jgi:hypothetical protein
MKILSVRTRQDEIDRRLGELCARSDCNEVALLMVERLDLALHGTSWARDATPRQVWRQLLAKVEQLAATDRQGAMR